MLLLLLSKVKIPMILFVTYSRILYHTLSHTFTYAHTYTPTHTHYIRIRKKIPLNFCRQCCTHVMIQQIIWIFFCRKTKSKQKNAFTNYRHNQRKNTWFSRWFWHVWFEIYDIVFIWSFFHIPTLFQCILPMLNLTFLWANKNSIDLQMCAL